MIHKEYWFARGYYDGRANGWAWCRMEDFALHELTEEDRHAYRRGYDCGVTDYCERDIEGGEA